MATQSIIRSTLALTRDPRLRTKVRTRVLQSKEKNQESDGFFRKKEGSKMTSSSAVSYCVTSGVVASDSNVQLLSFTLHLHELWETDDPELQSESCCFHC